MARSDAFAAIYVDLVADKKAVRAISEGANRPNGDVSCIIVSSISRRNNTITRQPRGIVLTRHPVQVQTRIRICIACWLPWKYRAKDSSAVGNEEIPGLLSETEHSIYVEMLNM